MQDGRVAGKSTGIDNAEIERRAEARYQRSMELEEIKAANAEKMTTLQALSAVQSKADQVMSSIAAAIKN